MRRVSHIKKLSLHCLVEILLYVPYAYVYLFGLTCKAYNNIVIKRRHFNFVEAFLYLKDTKCLMFVLNFRYSEPCREVFRYMILADNLTGVKQYVKNGFTDRNACTWAATAGSLGCLKFLIASRFDCTADVARAAATQGRLNCLEYLYTRGYRGGADVTYGAASVGYFECLDFLRLRGEPLTPITMTFALMYDQILCVQYLISRDCAFPDNPYEICATRGSLSCLRYLHSHLGLPFTNRLAYAAAEHFECFAYIFGQLSNFPNAHFVWTLLQGHEFCIADGFSASCLLGDTPCISMQLCEAIVSKQKSLPADPKSLSLVKSLLLTCAEDPCIVSPYFVWLFLE